MKAKSASAFASLSVVAILVAAGVFTTTGDAQAAPTTTPHIEYPCTGSLEPCIKMIMDSVAEEDFSRFTVVQDPDDPDRIFITTNVQYPDVSYVDINPTVDPTKSEFQARSTDDSWASRTGYLYWEPMSPNQLEDATRKDRIEEAFVEWTPSGLIALVPTGGDGPYAERMDDELYFLNAYTLGRTTAATGHLGSIPVPPRVDELAVSQNANGIVVFSFSEYDEYVSFTVQDAAAPFGWRTEVWDATEALLPGMDSCEYAEMVESNAMEFTCTYYVSEDHLGVNFGYAGGVLWATMEDGEASLKHRIPSGRWCRTYESFSTGNRDVMMVSGCDEPSANGIYTFQPNEVNYTTHAPFSTYQGTSPYPSSSVIDVAKGPHGLTHLLLRTSDYENQVDYDRSVRHVVLDADANVVHAQDMPMTSQGLDGTYWSSTASHAFTFNDEGGRLYWWNGDQIVSMEFTTTFT